MIFLVTSSSYVGPATDELFESRLDLQGALRNWAMHYEKEEEIEAYPSLLSTACSSQSCRDAETSTFGI